jgi:hypothetical protein
VHDVVSPVETNADQIATSYPEGPCQAPNPGALVRVDGVEGVVASSEGANFDNYWNGVAASDDVHFAAGDDHVSGDDFEALLGQVVRSE